MFGVIMFTLSATLMDSFIERDRIFYNYIILFIKIAYFVPMNINEVYDKKKSSKKTTSILIVNLFPIDV